MLELTFDIGASLCDSVRPSAVINKALAAHNSWGDGCDSWVLTEQDGLHVMEERMPPGKAEVRHLHRNVRQLYFVSAGTGTVCTIGKSSCLPVMLSTSRSGRRISF